MEPTANGSVLGLLCYYSVCFSPISNWHLLIDFCGHNPTNSGLTQLRNRASNPWLKSGLAHFWNWPGLCQCECQNSSHSPWLSAVREALQVYKMLVMNQTDRGWDSLLHSRNIKLLAFNGNSVDNQSSRSMNKFGLCSDNCTREKCKKH